MTTTYVMVPENEQWLMNDKKLHLTTQDVDVLIEHKKLFIKLMEKQKFSYQIELCKGTFRGKEELLYRSMETIDEIIKSMNGIEKEYQKSIGV